jgi:hypothetical protein
MYRSLFEQGTSRIKSEALPLEQVFLVLNDIISATEIILLSAHKKIMKGESANTVELGYNVIEGT